MKLTEEYILKHWEQDFDENLYFTHNGEGDAIGYDINTGEFSLENYWNIIDEKEATRLLRKR